MIAFLDANALIYLLEGEAALAGRVRTGLLKLSEQFGRMPIAMSRLSWMECRVKPLRESNTALLARYDTFFALPDLIWQELDRETIELATLVRAKHGLRTPNALQAACCLRSGSSHRFITGDRAFARVHGLECQFIAS